MRHTAAVFFDVDFTLIQPGPRFQGHGYEASCARHGVGADPARFDAAVAGAASWLQSADQIHDDELFVRYTARIVELMGGRGPAVERVAREIYADWAEYRHFTLYEDVPGAFRALHRRGIRIGLISNSHRRLDTFQAHFGLEGPLAAAVTSSEHGRMKPHPSIFLAALQQARVDAGESVMVGDSLEHDVEGARQVGMDGILLQRDRRPKTAGGAAPVIHSLSELAQML